MKVSKVIKKFAGDKDCIHWQYEPLEEWALRWLDKKKTKYRQGKATIKLPEKLVPEENLANLKKYHILLIAIPQKKIDEIYRGVADK